MMLQKGDENVLSRSMTTKQDSSVINEHKVWVLLVPKVFVENSREKKTVIFTWNTQHQKIFLFVFVFVFGNI